MASDTLQTFTDTNFDTSVIHSATPVLVDFWAEWCGPCRRLTPTVEALAKELLGRVAVGKVNVDENPAVTVKYNIHGIPTLLLFKDGQIVESVVGVVGKDELKKLIERHTA